MHEHTEKGEWFDQRVLLDLFLEERKRSITDGHRQGIEESRFINASKKKSVFEDKEFPTLSIGDGMSDSNEKPEHTDVAT